jgi:hypothetical protein
MLTLNLDYSEQAHALKHDLRYLDYLDWKAHCVIDNLCSSTFIVLSY